MTFFEHQERARRSTVLLVALYALAVIAVVAAVDLVIAAFYLSNVPERLPAGVPLGAAALLKAVPPGVYAAGTLGTLAAILAVTGVNVLRLASGGDAVASMVGARRVAPGSADPLERRLLNVVEEMAIASGVRVPNVYVMDGEAGINAFAAGYDVSHAVVAVTRGALEKLNRDELQGVIGHEFSHILNGDMRLNIRMIGVLAGIVFIGSVGQFLMRGAGRSRGRGAGGLFLAGLALFVIGYVGLFFAQMIKAAISRQREFLADASSVQFTRNPDGIAGALDQIGQSTALVGNRYAEDMSHMYFGKSAPALFDTHPPLGERIRRANPRFQVHEYRRTRAPALPRAEELAAAPAAPAAQWGRAGMRAGDLANAWGRTAGAAVALVGALDGAKLGVAQRLVRALPASLQAQLADAQGARAGLIALMLAPKAEVMETQLAALHSAGSGALAEAARRLAPEAAGLAPALKLPAIDLALPTLKSGSTEAKRELVAALEAVIRADRRVSLHEFCVLELVKSQLAPAPRPAAQRATLGSLAAEAAMLLALLAHAGRRPDSDAAAARQAFGAGAKQMGLGDPAMPARERLTLEAAAKALGALKRLAPLQQALLVKGLFAAATADGTIRVSEAELLRLVGAVLDCPLPPLLDEATSAS